MSISGHKRRKKNNDDNELFGSSNSNFDNQEDNAILDPMEWLEQQADIELNQEAQQQTTFLLTNDNIDNGQNEQEQEQEEEEPEFFEPKPLPSRRREQKELGKPGKRDVCFMCAYIGEKNTVLPSDDVNKIVEMLRQNTGRMDMVTLAKMIADYYAGFRRRINNQLMPGEIPLPPMSAATVVEHIRRHHQDPEVKQVVMLEELQELRESILNVVMEKNNKKKFKRANKIQVDCLEKIIKLELLVQSKDPAKMGLYAAGARLNPTAHRQGAVAGNTKNLFSYWDAMGGE